MIVIVVELRTIVVVRDGDGFSHAVESRDCRSRPGLAPMATQPSVPMKFQASLPPDAALPLM